MAQPFVEAYKKAGNQIPKSKRYLEFKVTGKTVDGLQCKLPILKYML